MAPRISILTAGTLGSISPMAALGLALKDEGYEVSVAAPENFRALIESMGLEYRRCGSDFSLFMKEEERNMLAGARSNVRQVLAWRFPPARARAMFDGVLRDAVAAAADADAIVFHPFVSVATDIAEAKGIPAVLVPLAFVSPSDETPLAMLPRPGKPFWNRISYGFLRLQRTAFSRTIQELRASLGLKKAFRYVHPHHVRGRRVPVLFPVSPLLRPRGSKGSDDIHFTGYWFRDEAPGWRPAGALAEFLASGEQPIYIGFGSMPGIGADRTAMLLEACEAANIRAILGRGWGDFGDASSLPKNVHVLDYAPHEHLFPLVRAVVHHGGLGTVSTGLRAGKPTLVCPFMLDQAYWGHRVAQLGAGPEPLPIARWTRERLTTALRALVENPHYRMHADAAGVEMREENGPVAAAKVVRDIVGGMISEKEAVLPLASEV
jgi:sterol 3beta-glucosyltransferase